MISNFSFHIMTNIGGFWITGRISFQATLYKVTILATIMES